MERKMAFQPGDLAKFDRESATILRSIEHMKPSPGNARFSVVASAATAEEQELR
jgi:hypothetical protein